MKTHINQYLQRNADESDFGGLFDDESLSSSVSKTEYQSGGGDPDLYSPNLKDKKAKNKIYKATLRLVPNVADVAKSKIMKFLYYFDTGLEKLYVDCPSNFGNKKSIITQAYFATYKHESASVRKLSENFKRKSYYWALAMIIEDQQYPELEGKIKIFRFGNQINEMIVKQGEESPGKSKVNVFNPFTGKDLYLDIREKVFDGNTQTTYEDSYFGENRTTIRINGKNIKGEASEQKLVGEFLKENSPNLLKMEAEPWTEEMEQKVIGIVRDLLIDNPDIFQKVYKEVYGRAYSGEAAKPRQEAPVTDNSSAKNDLASKLSNKTGEDDMPFVSDKTGDTKEKPTTEKAGGTKKAEAKQAEPAAAATEETNTGEEEDLEFNLEDLPDEN